MQQDEATTIVPDEATTIELSTASWLCLRCSLLQWLMAAAPERESGLLLTRCLFSALRETVCEFGFVSSVAGTVAVTSFCAAAGKIRRLSGYLINSKYPKAWAWQRISNHSRRKREFVRDFTWASDVPVLCFVFGWERNNATRNFCSAFFGGVLGV